ncbi:MAG: hypothetical protein HQL03_12590 [Nitrospirae bacterium]|nr:hypothetical protein [Nitrospirota bacterium]MBF0591107.1 hypothetical protein [Nitrospirota bacterium]
MAISITIPTEGSFILYVCSLLCGIISIVIGVNKRRINLFNFNIINSIFYLNSYAMIYTSIGSISYTLLKIQGGEINLRGSALDIIRFSRLPLINIVLSLDKAKIAKYLNIQCITLRIKNYGVKGTGPLAGGSEGGRPGVPPSFLLLVLIMDRYLSPRR